MAKTVDELLAKARAKLDRLTPEAAFEAQRNGALIVDTRTYEQRMVQGEIPGALVIDRTVFEWRLDPASAWRIPEVADPSVRVVVVCHEGFSSSLAAATLHELGLTTATDVIGGFDAWAEAGLPVIPAGPPDPGAASGGPCGVVGPVAGRAEHWDAVYRAWKDGEQSWFQADPERSLQLIEAAAPNRGARIVDVGAGTSLLVDQLVVASFLHPTVIDVSEAAVERARVRLGETRARVRWIIGDVTEVDDVGEVDVWHDRAVFHFLTGSLDRARYLGLARRSIVPGGTMILATFAPDAPPTCSGLRVRRYDADTLAAEVGWGFEPVSFEREVHVTPVGVEQPFTYGVFRRV